MFKIWCKCQAHSLDLVVVVWEGGGICTVNLWPVRDTGVPTFVPTVGTDGVPVDYIDKKTDENDYLVNSKTKMEHKNFSVRNSNDAEHRNSKKYLSSNNPSIDYFTLFYSISTIVFGALPRVGVLGLLETAPTLRRGTDILLEDDETCKISWKEAIREPPESARTYKSRVDIVTFFCVDLSL